MKRGDLVLVALPGDYGKTRPCLVIQSDVFDATESVTLCPLTTDQTRIPLLRLPVQAAKTSGLAQPSQVMVDKIMTVRRARIKGKIGRLSSEHMVAVERMLAVFLGIAG